jgi:hypothetical protein
MGAYIHLQEQKLVSNLGVLITCAVFPDSSLKMIYRLSKQKISRKSASKLEHPDFERSVHSIRIMVV